MDTDHGFMKLALEEAENALKQREVPVGCVLVLCSENGARKNVIGRGRNETNATGNATRHAEIVAVDEVHGKFAKGEFQGYESMEMLFKDVELFVNCEPCIMCASALGRPNLPVKRIVFGCSNDKFGGCGSVLHIDPQIETISGVLADEAVGLFRKFYARENPQSKQNLLEKHA